MIFWTAQYPIYADPPMNPPTAPNIIEAMRTITNNIIFNMSVTTFRIYDTSFVVNIFLLIQCEHDPLVYSIIDRKLLDSLML